MSGETEACEAIEALAESGFKAVQLTEEPKPWLTIKREHGPVTAAAISKIVLTIDPGAVRL